MGAIHEISEDVAIRLNTSVVMTIAARDVVEQCIRGSLAAPEVSPARMVGNIIIPRLGTYWNGQGGINAGLMLTDDGSQEYYLIVPPKSVGAHPRLRYAAAMDHARAIEIDGHKDFGPMKKREGRLAFVNAREQFHEDEAYWLEEQFSASSSWTQSFHNGIQGYWDKNDELRAVGVRRLFINSIIR